MSKRKMCEHYNGKCKDIPVRPHKWAEKNCPKNTDEFCKIIIVTTPKPSRELVLERALVIAINNITDSEDCESVCPGAKKCMGGNFHKYKTCEQAIKTHFISLAEKELSKGTKGKT